MRARSKSIGIAISIESGCNNGGGTSDCCCMPRCCPADCCIPCCSPCPPCPPPPCPPVSATVCCYSECVYPRESNQYYCERLLQPSQSLYRDDLCSRPVYPERHRAPTRTYREELRLPTKSYREELCLPTKSYRELAAPHRPAPVVLRPSLPPPAVVMAQPTRSIREDFCAPSLPTKSFRDENWIFRENNSNLARQRQFASNGDLLASSNLSRACGDFKISTPNLNLTQADFCEPVRSPVVINQQIRSQSRANLNGLELHNERNNNNYLNEEIQRINQQQHHQQLDFCAPSTPRKTEIQTINFSNEMQKNDFLNGGGSGGGGGDIFKRSHLQNDLQFNSSPGKISINDYSNIANSVSGNFGSSQAGAVDFQQFGNSNNIISNNVTTKLDSLDYCSTPKSHLNSEIQAINFKNDFRTNSNVFGNNSSKINIDELVPAIAPGQPSKVTYIDEFCEPSKPIENIIHHKREIFSPAPTPKLNLDEFCAPPPTPRPKTPARITDFCPPPQPQPAPILPPRVINDYCQPLPPSPRPIPIRPRAEIRARLTRPRVPIYLPPPPPPPAPIINQKICIEVKQAPPAPMPPVIAQPTLCLPPAQPTYIPPAQPMVLAPQQPQYLPPQTPLCLAPQPQLSLPPAPAPVQMPPLCLAPPRPAVPLPAPMPSFAPPPPQMQIQRPCIAPNCPPLIQFVPKVDVQTTYDLVPRQQVIRWNEVVPRSQMRYSYEVRQIKNPFC